MHLLQAGVDITVIALWLGHESIQTTTDTSYRAANWALLGETTGRGKQSNSYVPNRSIKEVLGYPLTKRFRALLTE